MIFIVFYDIVLGREHSGKVAKTKTPATVFFAVELSLQLPSVNNKTGLSFELQSFNQLVSGSTL